MIQTRDAKYPLGVLMVIMAGVCLSISGIGLRHVEQADGWQILFYRAIAFIITLLCFLTVRYRGRLYQPFRKIGVAGLFVAMFLGLGSVCYVFAILLTTVANAVFIVGATPIFTAAVAWLVLGERITGIAITTMMAALFGIGLMFADGLVAGRWLGNLVALGVVASFTGMLVLLRRSKAIDMLPATCLAGVVTAILSAIMVQSFVISPHDLRLAVLLGTVQFGGGFILITMGSRYVPAAEVALLSLTEAVLAPIWVWIGVNEVPSVLTLIGSTIVLVAVLTLGLSGIRRERLAG
ncbi:MAG: DMT family transporter [Gammaproteobacteria bacterium]|nr:DMT family transporter [Gammaproteobacteria bacterium]